jgi:AAA ATPase domain
MLPRTLHAIGKEVGNRLPGLAERLAAAADHSMNDGAIQEHRDYRRGRLRIRQARVTEDDRDFPDNVSFVRNNDRRGRVLAAVQLEPGAHVGAAVVLAARAVGPGGADPPRQSAARALVGRDRELALLRPFAGGAAVEGAALQLTGEPGVGKTALLDAAAEQASAAGARILRAGGEESEQDLGFSGLSQLLLPMYGESQKHSAAHHRALSAALGFGGPPPERLVVFTAALQLLRQVAEVQPLLVIIDDVHWLDQPSAAVLGFAARRLTGSRVRLLPVNWRVRRMCRSCWRAYRCRNIVSSANRASPRPR